MKLDRLVANDLKILVFPVPTSCGQRTIAGAVNIESEKLIMIMMLVLMSRMPNKLYRGAIPAAASA